MSSGYGDAGGGNVLPEDQVAAVFTLVHCKL